MKRITISLVLIFMIHVMLVSTVGADWAFKFVVYNECIYVITTDEIDKTMIDRKLGEVTYYSDFEGTYGGNFSNTFSEGTEYFEIKGFNTYEAIAIKTDEGKYIKADYDGEYAGKDAPIPEGGSSSTEEDTVKNHNDGIMWVLLTVLVVLIVILFIYIRQGKRNKTS